MFVVSERNIIIPGPNGEKFHMPRKYMGPVPAWVEKSAYFKALVKDKKVLISASGKDKDVDAALNRKKGGKKKPAPPDPNPNQEENPNDTPASEEKSDKEDEASDVGS